MDQPGTSGTSGAGGSYPLRKSIKRKYPSDDWKIIDLEYEPLPSKISRIVRTQDDINYLKFQLHLLCNQMNTSESTLNTTMKFKSALYNSVQDAMSDNADTRRIAEERIKAMEITDEFSIHLIELSLQKDIVFSVRQMSSVLLRQYIDNYWNASENRDLFFIPFDSRIRIKKLLIEGLKEQHRKIRSEFAFCVSSIGFVEWPEIWPGLFNEISALLKSGDEYAVFGALQVFEELIRESEGRRANELAPIIVEELCVMLADTDKYKNNTRMEAVQVLSHLINMYCIGREEIRETFAVKLPRLCELVLHNMPTEDTGICDYGFKTNIVKFLTLLVQKMSRQMAPYIPMILPVFWGMVMHYGEIYSKSVIQASHFLTELEDDEGKVVGFTPLVLAIFDFIHSIVDCTRLNRMLTDVLPDILYYALIFMQITKKMEDYWIADPSSFVEIDSTDSFETTVRVTARDVFMVICEDFEADIVFPALSHTVNRHLSEAEEYKRNGRSFWWKIHEVCMYSLGLIKPLCMGNFKNTLPFNLTTYMEHWHWQSAFQHPSLPLLLGRCMWFSGKYSSLLPATQLNSYLQTTLTYLRHSDLILKIFAIKTVMAYCEDIEDNPNKSLIVLSLPPIVDNLLEIMGQYCSYVFNSSLSTLKIILSIDKNFTLSIESRVVPIIIDYFLKHNSDPEVVYEIRHIIKEFCLHSECILQVQEKFIPILANILNANSEEGPPGLQAEAMDLLQTMVKCSKPPLSEVLIHIGFPAAVKCIIRSEDQMVLLSGGECLRSYLLLGVEQISNYSDSEGLTGLDYILQATSQLLDPCYHEQACKRIGRLIITLINKAGSVLGSSIHFILRAILSKMQRVDFLEIWQSLLIVFVYLFYTQLEAVLSFLTSIPGPTGVSALEFVLIEWLNRESYFHGFYERVVSVAGLSKLLEYSVTSDDDRFDNIMVRDEFISKVTDQRKQQGWTKIPVLGKAFKIILNELAYQMDSKASQQRTETSDTDDDESDDGSVNTQMSDYLLYDRDPDQQDLLYAQDPIFQINLLAYLTDFVHKFKTVPKFQWFVNYLTPKEKQTLASLGIFV